MKHFIKTLIVAVVTLWLLVFSPTLSTPVQAQGNPAAHEVTQTATVIVSKQLRGFHSSYHSGYRTPSSRVRSGSSSYRSSSGNPFTSRYSSTSAGSNLFSFGTGFLLGGMFHPFGGYYGYGYHSFSFFHLLFDLFILWLIWRFVRRFFWR